MSGLASLEPVMSPNPQPSPWRYAGLGLELAGGIAVFIGIGYLFDRWMGTDPWGMIVGAILGLAGGLYNMIREALQANR